jgi:hypothetical protein
MTSAHGPGLPRCGTKGRSGTAGGSPPPYDRNVSTKRAHAETVVFHTDESRTLVEVAPKPPEVDGWQPLGLLHDHDHGLRAGAEAEAAAPPRARRLG